MDHDMRRTEQQRIFNIMQSIQTDITCAVNFLQNSWYLGLNNDELSYTVEQLKIDAEEVDIDLENAINSLIIYRQRIKDLVDKTIEHHKKINVE